MTFNRVAGTYDRVRPDYPPGLFDDLIALAGLTPGDHLLEVGCGTGKATLPLARRGFRITAIEPGPDLAAVARRNLAGLDVEIIGEQFDDWRPGPGRRYAPPASWLSGARCTSSPTGVTRSSGISRRSTTRSAKGCPPARTTGPALGNCMIAVPRSRRAGCSA